MSLVRCYPLCPAAGPPVSLPVAVGRRLLSRPLPSSVPLPCAFRPSAFLCVTFPRRERGARARERAGNRTRGRDAGRQGQGRRGATGTGRGTARGGGLCSSRWPIPEPVGTGAPRPALLCAARDGVLGVGGWPAMPQLPVFHAAEAAASTRIAFTLAELTLRGAGPEIG